MQKSVTFLAGFFPFFSICGSEASLKDGKRSTGTMQARMVMSSIWLSLDRAIGIQVEEFISCFISPENISFMFSEWLKCCMENFPLVLTALT